MLFCYGPTGSVKNAVRRKGVAIETADDAAVVILRPARPQALRSHFP